MQVLDSTVLIHIDSAHVYHPSALLEKGGELEMLVRSIRVRKGLKVSSLSVTFML